MARKRISWAAVVVACAALLAGGWGAAETPSKSPQTYASKELGISFVVPAHVKLYTADNPGPLGSQISGKKPIILVNPEFTEESINLLVSEGVTENDVLEYKKALDENPVMSLPGYKRVSVALIKVGKEHKQVAVEHIFFMKGNIEGKLRSITLAHKGKGFTFTCATSPERFDKTNKEFFDALFDSMTFE